MMDGRGEVNDPIRSRLEYSVTELKPYVECRAVAVGGACICSGRCYHAKNQALGIQSLRIGALRMERSQDRQQAEGKDPGPHPPLRHGIAARAGGGRAGGARAYAPT